MHWDYLKSWSNFRRQLSKRHVTPKINFCKTKKSRKIHHKTALVWFFVISLTSSGHSSKACIHCSTQKHIFIFLRQYYVISVFWAFKKDCNFINFFSLCIMFGMHFNNFSVLLNSVAAAYVHLATSSVTITCWYVHAAKLEIHTLSKWSVANWHYNKVDSTH